MTSKRIKWQSILGWTAVAIILMISSLWAYWGGIENFHEGWYSKNIWENILMMFIQYWLFALVFIMIGLIGSRFPKASLPLCVALGIAAAVFFSGASFSVLWVMIIIPCTIIGLFFFFGRIKPRKLAYTLIISIPIAILFITSTLGTIRVSKRMDDGNYGQRIVETDHICLLWAPRGAWVA